MIRAKRRRNSRPCLDPRQLVLFAPARTRNWPEFRCTVQFDERTCAILACCHLRHPHRCASERARAVCGIAADDVAEHLTLLPLEAHPLKLLERREAGRGETDWL